MSWRRNHLAIAVDAEPRETHAGVEGRYSPQAECGNKRAFASKAEAVRGIVPRGHWQELDVYACSYCSLWHIGHAPHERLQIICAGCGRPWRPRIWRAKDGSVIRQRDPDPARCNRCQPAVQVPA